MAPRAATNGQAFYLVQRVPLEESRDTDGDGIDDPWEIGHGLNPLRMSDATRVAPGTTRTALEIYTAENALNYEYSPGQSGWCSALTQHPFTKDVFAAGSLTGANGIKQGIIIRSEDGGKSYTIPMFSVTWPPPRF